MYVKISPAGRALRTRPAGAAMATVILHGAPPDGQAMLRQSEYTSWIGVGPEADGAIHLSDQVRGDGATVLSLARTIDGSVVVRRLGLTIRDGDWREFRWGDIWGSLPDVALLTVRGIPENASSTFPGGPIGGTMDRLLRPGRNQGRISTRTDSRQVDVTLAENEQRELRWEDLPRLYGSVAESELGMPDREFAGEGASLGPYETVEASYATVVIDDLPEGAQVSIDKGAFAPVGDRMFKRRDIAAGSHIFEVAVGPEVRELDVELAPGQLFSRRWDQLRVISAPAEQPQEFVAAPQDAVAPTTGTIVVRGLPAGAEVSIDKGAFSPAAWGVFRPAGLQSVGEHLVEARVAGETRAAEVQVVSGQETEVQWSAMTVVAQPGAAAPQPDEQPPGNIIFIRGLPRAWSVTVDGIPATADAPLPPDQRYPIGGEGSWRSLGLATGEHVVVASKETPPKRRFSRRVRVGGSAGERVGVIFSVGEDGKVCAELPSDDAAVPQGARDRLRWQAENPGVSSQAVNLPFGCEGQTIQAPDGTTRRFIATSEGYLVTAPAVRTQELGPAIPETTSRCGRIETLSAQAIGFTVPPESVVGQPGEIVPQAPSVALATDTRSQYCEGEIVQAPNGQLYRVVRSAAGTLVFELIPTRPDADLPRAQAPGESDAGQEPVRKPGRGLLVALATIVVVGGVAAGSVLLSDDE